MGKRTRCFAPLIALLVLSILLQHGEADLVSSRPSSLQKQSRCFSSSSSNTTTPTLLRSSPPLDPNLFPPVSNGYLGTSLDSPSMYVAGLYVNEVEWLEAACLQFPKVGRFVNPRGKYELSGLCARLDDWFKADDSKRDFIEKGMGSRRARIDSPFAFSLKLDHADDAQSTTTQMYLDYEHGFTGKEYNLKNATAKTTLFAHRGLKNVLVFTVELDNRVGFSPLSVVLDQVKPLGLSHNILPFPKDVLFTPVSFDGDTSPDIKCFEGPISRPETPDSAVVTVGFCQSVVPSRLTARAGHSSVSVFAASVHVGASAAASSYSELLSLNLSKPEQAAADLRASHAKAVDAARGDACVVVEGDDDLNTKLATTQLYLLSAARAREESAPEEYDPYPPSPGGLSTNGYFGQVFWDTEVWISLAFLPFNVELAKVSLDYRLKRLPAARLHASSESFAGCWIPWQSGFSGEDVSLAPFANRLEIHTGAGVSLLAARVYDATGDDAWLGEVGGVIAACVADFYASRATRDKGGEGRYELKGVVGPDEFANGRLYQGVDNNPYTNAVVKKALEFAVRSEKIVGREPPQNWSDVAAGLAVKVNSTSNFHPEYDGFEKDLAKGGLKVKQADVAMLVYPTDYTYENSDILLNDLSLYEQLYDEGGPAMTYGVHAIGHLESNARDEQKVYEATKMSMRTMQPPFNVWTETVDPAVHKSDMGCYNFLTAAGGFLQSVVHGFLGIRYREDYLRVAPKLMASEKAQQMSVLGLKYLGRELDIVVSRDGNISFSLRSGENLKLQADYGEEEDIFELVAGGETRNFSLTFSASSFKIFELN